MMCLCAGPQSTGAVHPVCPGLDLLSASLISYETPTRSIIALPFLRVRKHAVCCDHSPNFFHLINRAWLTRCFNFSSKFFKRTHDLLPCGRSGHPQDFVVITFACA